MGDDFLTVKGMDVVLSFETRLLFGETRGTRNRNVIARLSHYGRFHPSHVECGNAAGYNKINTKGEL